MSRTAPLSRLLVIAILALVALSIASHFLVDVMAASYGADREGNFSAERSRPIASTGIVCNAVLHIGYLLAPVAIALSVPVFFRLWVDSRQDSRIWAPLSPFRPPIFA